MPHFHFHCPVRVGWRIFEHRRSQRGALGAVQPYWSQRSHQHRPLCDHWPGARARAWHGHQRRSVVPQWLLHMYRSLQPMRLPLSSAAGYCCSASEEVAGESLPSCSSAHTQGCLLRSTTVEDEVVVGDRCILLEGSLVEKNAVLAPGSGEWLGGSKDKSIVCARRWRAQFRQGRHVMGASGAVWRVAKRAAGRRALLIAAARAVVPPARRIPSGELWAGNPAKFVRKLTKDEVGCWAEWLVPCGLHCRSMHGPRRPTPTPRPPPR